MPDARFLLLLGRDLLVWMVREAASSRSGRCIPLKEASDGDHQEEEEKEEEVGVDQEMLRAPGSSETGRLV